MKTVKVVAAVIRSVNDEGAPIIFATARGYGEFKGGWEFPGGKVEPGETADQALVREIREELTAQIVVGEFLKTIEYDYPNFHLSMDCFFCRGHFGRADTQRGSGRKVAYGRGTGQCELASGGLRAH